MKHLFKIGTIFYYRRRTPKFLQLIVPKPMIQFSLKTANRHQAKYKIDKVDAVISEIKVGLDMNLLDEAEIIKRLTFCGIIKATPTVCASEIKVCNLSKLFEAYKKERLLTEKWLPKTALENQKCFDVFIKFAGDKPPSSYSHQKLLEYRGLLLKLPPNMNQNPRTKGKTLSKILAMKHSKTLSIAQVNKYMISLSGFWSWLHRTRQTELNIGTHLTLPKSRKVRQDLERLAYSVEEIKKIKSELLDQRESFGKHQCRYWVPLIALYSGLRLTEVCQLYLSDVQETDGVLCFDINEKEDKRLKTEFSARIIPAHPKLIELGFLGYLEKMRDNISGRLFPTLYKERYHGYGRQMSKWFSKWNRQYITEEKRKTFHSIRHSVSTALKYASAQKDSDNISAELISELLGHHQGRISIARYGKRFPPKILLKALLKLPW